MEEKQIEINVKGKWVTVPALDYAGKTIALRGGAVKIGQIHDEDWLASELEDPAKLIAELKRRGVGSLRPDIFTFAQKPPATVPKYPYVHEMDSLAVVRTTDYNAWWEGLSQETRKNVRRAQKRGVEVSLRPFSDELVRDIMGVNNDSPLRQGKPNVHYGKSFEQVKRDHSSFVGQSDYVCAYMGEELIGFLKMIHRGDVYAILNIVSKASHNDKRPTNALVAKAIEVCNQRGVSYLTYVKFNYGNKGDNPLREFKIRNGFTEMLVPRFYIPITPKGALWMKMGLHRGLHGILPQGAIKMGIKARAAWYNRSHQRANSV